MTDDPFDDESPWTPPTRLQSRVMAAAGLLPVLLTLSAGVVFLARQLVATP